MTLSDQKKYSDANGTTKRVFDILLSLAMLILTSPILLVIALAIKLYAWRTCLLPQRTHRSRWNPLYPMEIPKHGC